MQFVEKKLAIDLNIMGPVFIIMIKFQSL